MYDEQLQQIEKQGLLRSIRWIDSPQGPHVTIEGRSFIQMSGNNYLGLAEDIRLRQASIHAIEAFGIGSGASRLLSGSMTPHRELEDRLARFKNTEAALVFSTGYMANLALLSCLIPEDGIILLDRLSHASLIDGARLSGRKFRTYAHKDLDRLEQLLRQNPPKKPALIVTDGVFSMDGDIAPLPELLSLARKYKARILLDDAHGIGVLGKTGRGTLEHFGIDPNIEEIIQMGTLGKAIGVFGAYVVGKHDLIKLLINQARTLIYTTALPPALCAAATTAIDLIDHEPTRRKQLWENRHYLHDGLLRLGFKTLGSQTPIIPILTYQIEPTLQLSKSLLDHGILALPIRPPTVPRKRSRIRLSVMATHSREDLDFVLKVFEHEKHHMDLLPED